MKLNKEVSLLGQETLDEIICWEELAWPNLAKIHLSQEEVHIWRISNESQSHLSTFFSFLSNDERLRADKYKFAADSSRFIRGRGLLRLLLNAYSGTNPAQIVFRYGDYGKPYISLPNKDIKFSVSHSQEITMYAFSELDEVGIDVEFRKNKVDWRAIGRYCFTAKEMQLLEKMTVEEAEEAFLASWTRMEAIAKATGEGLSGLWRPSAYALNGSEFRSVHFSVDSDYIANLVFSITKSRASFFEILM